MIFRVSRALGRWVILLAILWLIAEYLLLSAVAARIGWGGTLMLLTLKGAAGLGVLGWLMISGFRAARHQGDRREGRLVRAGFQTAAAVLITLPGLALACGAITLLSPSVQGWVLRRLARRAGTKADDGVIELSAAEWREIGRRRRLSRKKAPKAALETNPPTV